MEHETGDVADGRPDRPVTVGAGPVGPPERLDGGERAAWRGVVAIMCSLPRALDGELQRDAGLTFFEYMVLSVLAEHPDRAMQMSDVATAVSASLSRLSHVVAKLEREGLVQRRRMPGAGRRTSASITDDGHARAVAAAPGYVAAVRALFMDAAEPGDLMVLRRLGAAVDRAIYPERPGIHDAAD